MIKYWTQPSKKEHHKSVCGTDVEIILHVTTGTYKTGSEICITKPFKLKTLNPDGCDDEIYYLVWIDDDIVAECKDAEMARQLLLMYIPEVYRMHGEYPLKKA